MHRLGIESHSDAMPFLISTYALIPPSTAYLFLHIPPFFAPYLHLYRPSETTDTIWATNFLAVRRHNDLTTRSTTYTWFFRGAIHHPDPSHLAQVILSKLIFPCPYRNQLCPYQLHNFNAIRSSSFLFPGGEGNLSIKLAQSSGLTIRTLTPCYISISSTCALCNNNLL